MNELKELILDGAMLRINGKEFPVDHIENINLSFSPGTVAVDIKYHETMKVVRKCV